MSKFLTLRFSGCGHLLPYHLGVASVFLEETSRSTRKRSLPPIKAVSGSSAGAIAAVMYAKLPHRIDEFVSDFIEQRGNALKILTKMMYEEENAANSETGGRNGTIVSWHKKVAPPRLSIATTKCRDGSVHMFTFTGNTLYKSISSTWTTDKVLNVVKASCTIPNSFHPMDMLSQSRYPIEEGIEIDGEYHVDGGIAAPVPHTSRDGEEGAHAIVVSPISKGDSFIFKDSKKNEMSRISPIDTSWRLLPVGSVKLNGNFDVKPSVQNLKCLRMASGLVSSSELREWYEMGMTDSISMINKLLR
jgi:predicted acylesterase/phospholipase RssA